MTPVRRRLVVAVSTAQLACGVAGLVLALRRGHPFDLLLMRGREDALARDSLLVGTALSAPAWMLAVQGGLTARLATRPDRASVRGLRLLAVAMVAGYLSERLVRDRVRSRGWDPVESPVALIGLSLAAALAVLATIPERSVST